MENKSNSVNQPPTIDDIINEIKRKSEHSDYVYRGERKNHEKVSSALYREYFDDEDINVNFQGFDLRDVQRGMLNVAKKHIGESPVGPLEHFADVTKTNKHFMLDWEESLAETIKEVAEREILTELQHYGGKTNLIDFTTDYLIAIFFACTGDLTEAEDGRVILLEKTKQIEKEMVIRPQNPRHRIIAQKSIFLYPPDGFIEVPEDNIVYIPADLKQPMQKYLRKYHDISSETIYNDIHGFITNQNIHQRASKAFYLGLTFQYKGYHTEPSAEKQQAYKDAIAYYNQVIELNSEDEAAYNNRGECWLHLKEWDKARKDLTIAQDMGSDIVAAFHWDYKGGVEEFKEKTGIQMPKHITVLLGY